MTNTRPEERERKARHYRGKKMVTAKKATTNRTKSEFISTLSNRAAKTNVLFPACFAHARYSSWMIGRFLNLGDHGKPKSGKIKGRCQPMQSASSRYCKRQLVIKNNTGDWSQSESAKYFEWIIVLIFTNIYPIFHWFKASGVKKLGKMGAIVPLIKKYIGLKMRFIHGIFDWKLGFTGNIPLINPHFQTVAVYSRRLKR